MDDDLWWKHYWRERQARIDAQHIANGVLAAHEHLCHNVGLAVHLHHVEQKNKRLVNRVLLLEEEAASRNDIIRELRKREREHWTPVPWWKRFFCRRCSHAR